ncbi:GmrSD restriction endonuclease domain-containing protein [Pseudonocardia alaniniphila]|uniref:DUF262 domain-containing protein n=1 Tax=Pseudonocardia alaniniphila TaxID=75291 RepID=A0ABS9T9F9_9PSEU|nr:DUF262 domain-containing protein [Pseudonocardia alaniniphila]MCH6165167.1 DUF262 domain-containing protein [Pseudonocardia alaniniphila]
MAGGGITGKAFHLASLFERVTYAIEYYQREYAWSADDVRTLLSDLVEEFERSDGVRRSWRATPAQFFLGPFVYTEEDGDRRFLVDGQQRFTTLHLIFLHLLRLIPEGAGHKTRDRLNRAIVAGYDGSRPRFRLAIDERQKPLEALLNGRPYELGKAVSLSVQTLWERSAQIEEELAQRLDSDQHGRFVDWLLDSVVMVGIEAVDRNNGFRIFESMNDRGARLTSVDLIKSFLLSRANRDEEKLNENWRTMLAEVTRVRGDTNAPRDFLKAFLVARHADLRQDSDDAEKIDRAPHEWTREHAAKIGLRDDGESYLDFVTELIDLGRHYADLAAATVKPRHENELAALFYNHANGVTAQMALILAAIRPDDPPSLVKEKAKVAANFVDLLYVLRAVHDESTRAEDINREVRELIPLVRGCSTAGHLGTILGAQLPELDFDVMQTFGLRGDNRAQVRYVLARLTAYVENEMGEQDVIEKYLSTDRSWQIEHVFADHPERHPELEPLQFRLLRNRLGGLGLLPASDNASVRDLPFGEKAQWYQRHTALLAVLAPGYDKRHPALHRISKSHGVERTLRAFGASTPMQKVVDVRGQLYQTLAQRIWDPARLGLALPPAEATEETPATTNDSGPSVRSSPRPRRTRRTELAVLVADGRITPGVRLHGTHRGTRHEARVDAEGQLWLTDTDSFRLPDEAGRIATGLKSCAGWRFWHITLTDGTAVPLGQFRDERTLVAR